MRKILLGFVFTIFLFGFSSAQTRSKTAKFPAGVPVKQNGVEATGGKVEDRTYLNSKFGFQLTIPENWFIAGTDFEKVVKENGHDLSIDTAKANANRSIDILMTAFRSEPGASDGAILRVTSENLKTNPQIRDAVDYFDAITAAYASAKLPGDFTYSSTKAEQLGLKQFAYLDTSSDAGKKRMYATVRKGHAIMFTLSYNTDEDLQTLRHILQAATFTLK